jgi:hypothetical protein
VSENPPDIDPVPKANVRNRVLPDHHFEFRGGAAVPMREPAQHQDQPVLRSREARLRSEYAHIYPGLIPGIWELAAVVVEKVIAWRLQLRRGLVDRDRVLDPRHFDFRGSYRLAGEIRSRKGGATR